MYLRKREREGGGREGERRGDIKKEAQYSFCSYDALPNRKKRTCAGQVLSKWTLQLSAAFRKRRAMARDGRSTK